MTRKEITRALVKRIKENGFDREFAEKILIIVENEDDRIKLTKYFDENQNKELTTTDVLIQAIDITRKADLIEGEFYRINPDLKE